MGSGASKQLQSPDYDRTHQVLWELVEKACPGRLSSVDDPILHKVTSQVRDVQVTGRPAIIHKGSPGKFLYILLEGHLEVIDSEPADADGDADDVEDDADDVEDDNDVCLARINAPAVVGEVSILFKCEHTATVRATPGCKLRAIANEVISPLVDQNEISMLDWFKENQYVVTRDEFGAGLWHREVLKDTLAKVALFSEWSDDALDDVISCLDTDWPITICPAGSLLIRQGDDYNDLVIIVRGRVSIWREDLQIDDVTIMPSLPASTKTTPAPFSFTEKALFVHGSHQLSLVTESPTLVIYHDKSNLQNVISKNAEAGAWWSKADAEWSRRMEDIPNEHQNAFGHQLLPEMLRRRFEQQGSFPRMSALAMERLAKLGVIEECPAWRSLLIGEDALLLLRGTLVLRRGLQTRNPFSEEVGTGDIMYLVREGQETEEVKALAEEDDCILVRFRNDDIRKEMQRQSHIIKS